MPLQSIFKDVISGNGEDYETRVGRVSVFRGSLVIQNCSGQVWKVFQPKTREIEAVADGQWFLVMPGTQILFDEKHNIVGKVDDPCA